MKKVTCSKKSKEEVACAFVQDLAIMLLDAVSADIAVYIP
jgi:hypothetical protein